MIQISPLSNTMVFFSKWLVFSPSSDPGHVPIAQIPAPASWHMVQHSLVLCVSSVHSRCISSHKPSAYTLSVYEIGGGGAQ